MFHALLDLLAFLDVIKYKIVFFEDGPHGAHDSVEAARCTLLLGKLDDRQLGRLASFEYGVYACEELDRSDMQI